VIDEVLLKIKNRKLVMILTPILGGAFIGGAMVVKPALNRIRVLEQEKNSLVSKAGLFTNIIGLDKKMSDYKERLGAAPAKAEWLEELNDYATEAGLNILSLTPVEKQLVGPYLEETSVQIDAEGFYHQLGQFVSRVESMKQVVRVLSLEISGNRGKDSESQSDFEGPIAPQRLQIKGPQKCKISLTVGLFYPQKDAL
jgi:Tfp pilus assembly protein PilO